MTETLQHLTPGRFYGRKERLLETQGFVLSEVRYDPNQRVPPHGHVCGYFCLLIGGSYQEQYGRRLVDYSPRSIVFHPPGDEHHGEIGNKGGRCFNIEVGEQQIERLWEHGPAPADPIDFHRGDLVWTAARMYREFRHPETASALVVEGLGLEMLGGLLRQSVPVESRPPSWLRSALDRLHDEFDQPLTVDRVACDLGVSSVRLSRAFRRFYGETMGDRLRRLRVERACERLAKTDDTRLADLAFDLGFADQSHFTRVFKRHTGFTPGQYRRLCSS